MDTQEVNKVAVEGGQWGGQWGQGKGAKGAGKGRGQRQDLGGQKGKGGRGARGGGWGWCRRRGGVNLVFLNLRCKGYRLRVLANEVAPGAHSVIAAPCVSVHGCGADAVAVAPAALPVHEPPGPGGLPRGAIRGKGKGGKEGEEGECFDETSQFIGGTPAETMVAEGSKGRQTRN